MFQRNLIVDGFGNFVQVVLVLGRFLFVFFRFNFDFELVKIISCLGGCLVTLVLFMHVLYCCKRI